MKYARSHDGKAFVMYVALDNAPEHIRAYAKYVLPYNRAYELHHELARYLAEQEPPPSEWLEQQ